MGQLLGARWRLSRLRLIAESGGHGWSANALRRANEAAMAMDQELATATIDLPEEA